MKLYEALARALHDHGIDTMFGLLADPTMLFADTFVRETGGTFISAAHEAGATHMAYGYGAVSGRLGVVTVDHGPGLTNAVTALVEAAKARAPMLMVCPDTIVEKKFYRQNINQREVIAPTGAGFEQVRSPRTVLMDTAVAIRRTHAEGRPIVLNVPREFLSEEVDYERIVLEPTPMPHANIDESSLDEAVGIVATAQRPIVLAGRGAIHARAELLQFAERIGAPVATTLGGKDLFRGEPFDLGIMGTLSSSTTVDIIAQADCIIAFGAGLNDDTTMQGSALDGKRVIQCDIDPSRLGNFTQVDSMVLGDAATLANTIVEWLDEAEVPSSSFCSPEMVRRLEAAQDDDQAAGPPSSPGTVEIRRAIRRIDQAVPTDRIYVNGPGRHAMVTWPGVHVRHPRDFVITAHFGAIGTGMPVAVGAACADRDRPTLLVAGDGDFMLGGLNEFNSAVRHGVDLIAVICNDGSYGPEHQMLVDWGYDPGIVEFEWPDFGPVAEALGGQGVTVRNEQDLDTACDVIGSREGPVLIDLKLDPYGMPDIPH